MAIVNTPGLKFGKGNLFIKYSEEFGNAVVSNETVEISKGEILQNSLYSINYQDASSQTISVVADSDYGSNELYTFSASPESILHIKLKIEDFTQIGSLSFDDIDITGQVYYWCRGGYQLFDEVILDGPITSVESQPGSEIGITYSFENLTAINNETKLQFDIFAVAEEPTNYSIGYVYVEYNSLGFPSNQVSGGTLQFTRGTIINDQNTYDVEILDYNGSGFFIHSTPFFDADPNNLYNLGTEPKKYGTVVLDVSNCSADANLTFDEVQMNDDRSTHYTGNTPIPF